MATETDIAESSLTPKREGENKDLTSIQSTNIGVAKEVDGDVNEPPEAVTDMSKIENTGVEAAFGKILITDSQGNVATSKGGSFLECPGVARIASSESCNISEQFQDEGHEVEAEIGTGKENEEKKERTDEREANFEAIEAQSEEGQGPASKLRVDGFNKDIGTVVEAANKEESEGTLSTKTPQIQEKLADTNSAREEPEGADCYSMETNNRPEKMRLSKKHEDAREETEKIKYESIGGVSTKAIESPAFQNEKEPTLTESGLQKFGLTKEDKLEQTFNHQDKFKSSEKMENVIPLEDEIRRKNDNTPAYETQTEDASLLTMDNKGYTSNKFSNIGSEEIVAKIMKAEMKRQGDEKTGQDNMVGDIGKATDFLDLKVNGSGVKHKRTLQSGDGESTSIETPYEENIGKDGVTAIVDIYSISNTHPIEIEKHEQQDISKHEEGTDGGFLEKDGSEMKSERPFNIISEAIQKAASSEYTQEITQANEEEVGSIENKQEILNNKKDPDGDILEQDGKEIKSIRPLDIVSEEIQEAALSERTQETTHENEDVASPIENKQEISEHKEGPDGSFLEQDGPKITSDRSLNGVSKEIQETASSEHAQKITNLDEEEVGPIENKQENSKHEGPDGSFLEQDGQETKSESSLNVIPEVNQEAASCEHIQEIMNADEDGVGPLENEQEISKHKEAPDEKNLEHDGPEIQYENVISEEIQKDASSEHIQERTHVDEKEVSPIENQKEISKHEEYSDGVMEKDGPRLKSERSLNVISEEISKADSSEHTQERKNVDEEGVGPVENEQETSKHEESPGEFLKLDGPEIKSERCLNAVSGEIQETALNEHTHDITHLDERSLNVISEEISKADSSEHTQERKNADEEEVGPIENEQEASKHEESPGGFLKQDGPEIKSERCLNAVSGEIQETASNEHTRDITHLEEEEVGPLENKQGISEDEEDLDGGFLELDGPEARLYRSLDVVSKEIQKTNSHVHTQKMKNVYEGVGPIENEHEIPKHEEGPGKGLLQQGVPKIKYKGPFNAISEEIEIAASSEHTQKMTLVEEEEMGPIGKVEEKGNKNDERPTNADDSCNTATLNFPPTEMVDNIQAAEVEIPETASSEQTDDITNLDEEEVGAIDNKQGNSADGEGPDGGFLEQDGPETKFGASLEVISEEIQKVDSNVHTQEMKIVDQEGVGPIENGQEIPKHEEGAEKGLLEQGVPEMKYKRQFNAISEENQIAASSEHTQKMTLVDEEEVGPIDKVEEKGNRKDERPTNVDDSCKTATPNSPPIEMDDKIQAADVEIPETASTQDITHFDKEEVAPIENKQGISEDREGPDGGFLKQDGPETKFDRSLDVISKEIQNADSNVHTQEMRNVDEGVGPIKREQEISKHEEGPEEGLSEQDVPEMKSERQFNVFSEEIQIAVSSEHTQKTTLVHEEEVGPIENVQEKGNRKDERPTNADDSCKTATPNSPPMEMADKIQAPEVEIPEKNTNDVHLSLIEETSKEEGERKHTEELSDVYKSSDVEHISTEGFLIEEMTSVTDQALDEKIEHVHQVETEQVLEVRDAGEHKEAVQIKDEDADNKIYEITTKGYEENIPDAVIGEGTREQDDGISLEPGREDIAKDLQANEKKSKKPIGEDFEESETAISYETYQNDHRNASIINQNNHSYERTSTMEKKRGDEVIQENSKDDERDVIDLKDKVKDSSEFIQETKATSFAIEKKIETQREKAEWGEYLDATNTLEESEKGIRPNKGIGNLVENFSLVSEAPDKKIEAEPIQKQETTCGDTESGIVEMSLSNIDPEEKKQIDSFSPAYDEIKYTKTMGNRVEDADINAEETSNSEQCTMVKIPRAEKQGANEGEVHTWKMADDTVDIVSQINVHGKNHNSEMLVENILDEQRNPVDVSRLDSVDFGKQSENEELQVEGEEGTYNPPGLNTGNNTSDESKAEHPLEGSLMEGDGVDKGTDGSVMTSNYIYEASDTKSIHTFPEEISDDTEATDPREKIQDQIIDRDIPVKDPSVCTARADTFVEGLLEKGDEMNVTEATNGLDLDGKVHACEDATANTSPSCEEISDDIEATDPREKIQDQVVDRDIPVKDPYVATTRADTFVEGLLKKGDGINVTEATIGLDLDDKVRACENTTAKTSPSCEEVSDDIGATDPRENIQDQIIDRDIPVRDPSIAITGADTFVEGLLEKGDGINVTEATNGLNLDDKVRACEDATAKSNPSCEEISDDIEATDQREKIQDQIIDRDMPVKDPSTAITWADTFAEGILEKGDGINVTEATNGLDLDDKVRACEDATAKTSPSCEEISDDIEATDPRGKVQDQIIDRDMSVKDPSVAITGADTFVEGLLEKGDGINVTNATNRLDLDDKADAYEDATAKTSPSCEEIVEDSQPVFLEDESSRGTRKKELTGEDSLGKKTNEEFKSIKNEIQKKEISEDIEAIQDQMIDRDMPVEDPSVAITGTDTSVEGLLEKGDGINVTEATNGLDLDDKVDACEDATAKTSPSCEEVNKITQAKQEPCTTGTNDKESVNISDEKESYINPEIQPSTGAGAKELPHANITDKTSKTGIEEDLYKAKCLDPEPPFEGQSMGQTAQESEKGEDQAPEPKQVTQDDVEKPQNANEEIKDILTEEVPEGVERAIVTGRIKEQIIQEDQIVSKVKQSDVVPIENPRAVESDEKIETVNPELSDNNPKRVLVSSPITQELEEKRIQQESSEKPVGASTFMPVISKANIEEGITKELQPEEKPVYAFGITSEEKAPQNTEIIRSAPEGELDSAKLGETSELETQLPSRDNMHKKSVKMGNPDASEAGKTKRLADQEDGIEQTTETEKTKAEPVEEERKEVSETLSGPTIQGVEFDEITESVSTEKDVSAEKSQEKLPESSSMLPTIQQEQKIIMGVNDNEKENETVQDENLGDSFSKGTIEALFPNKDPESYRAPTETSDMIGDIKDSPNDKPKGQREITDGVSIFESPSESDNIIELHLSTTQPKLENSLPTEEAKNCEETPNLGLSKTIQESNYVPKVEIPEVSPRLEEEKFKEEPLKTDSIELRAEENQLEAIDSNETVKNNISNVEILLEEEKLKEEPPKTKLTELRVEENQLEEVIDSNETIKSNVSNAVDIKQIVEELVEARETNYAPEVKIPDVLITPKEERLKEEPPKTEPTLLRGEENQSDVGEVVEAKDSNYVSKVELPKVPTKLEKEQLPEEHPKTEFTELRTKEDQLEEAIDSNEIIKNNVSNVEPVEELVQDKYTNCVPEVEMPGVAPKLEEEKLKEEPLKTEPIELRAESNQLEAINSDEIIKNIISNVENLEELVEAKDSKHVLQVELPEVLTMSEEEELKEEQPKTNLTELKAEENQLDAEELVEAKDSNYALEVEIPEVSTILEEKLKEEPLKTELPELRAEEDQLKETTNSHEVIKNVSNAEIVDEQIKAKEEEKLKKEPPKTKLAEHRAGENQLDEAIDSNKITKNNISNVEVAEAAAEAGDSNYVPEVEIPEVITKLEVEKIKEESPKTELIELRADKNQLQEAINSNEITKNSISNAEAIQELIEAKDSNYVPEREIPEVLTKWEEGKLEEGPPEIKITEQGAEENQLDEAIDSNETSKNNISNEEIVEELVEEKDSQTASISEESFRETERELTKDYPGKKTDGAFKTNINKDGIQTIELSEDIESPDAWKKIKNQIIDGVKPLNDPCTVTIGLELQNWDGASVDVTAEATTAFEEAKHELPTTDDKESVPINGEKDLDTNTGILSTTCAAAGETLDGNVTDNIKESSDIINENLVEEAVEVYKENKEIDAPVNDETKIPVEDEKYMNADSVPDRIAATEDSELKIQDRPYKESSIAFTEDQKQHDSVSDKKTEGEGRAALELKTSQKEDEEIHLLTKEIIMRPDEAEIDSAICANKHEDSPDEKEKPNIISENQVSRLHIVQEIDTVALGEVKEKQLDKNSHATPQKQIPREADPNGSTETETAVGSTDVAQVLQVTTSGTETEAKGDKCGGEKRIPDSREEISEPTSTETLDVQKHTEGGDGDGDAFQVGESNKDGEKEEKEGGEKKGLEAELRAPVMVEVSTDKDAKVVHKKSHNILLGVGSKVKHSIAKVKKAITGKSSHSHPKPASIAKIR